MIWKALGEDSPLEDCLTLAQNWQRRWVTALSASAKDPQDKGGLLPLPPSSDAMDSGAILYAHKHTHIHTHTHTHTQGSNTRGSENHPKSAHQHHSGSPVSCDSMKGILHWPEGAIIFPNCPPVSGAHPWSPGKIPSNHGVEDGSKP